MRVIRVCSTLHLGRQHYFVHKIFLVAYLMLTERGISRGAHNIERELVLFHNLLPVLWQLGENQDVYIPRPFYLMNRVMKCRLITAYEHTLSSTAIGL